MRFNVQHLICVNDPRPTKISVSISLVVYDNHEYIKKK